MCSATLLCKTSLFLNSLSKHPKDSRQRNESTETEEKLSHGHHGSGQQWGGRGDETFRMSSTWLLTPLRAGSSALPRKRHHTWTICLSATIFTSFALLSRSLVSNSRSPGLQLMLSWWGQAPTSNPGSCQHIEKQFPNKSQELQPNSHEQGLGEFSF